MPTTEHPERATGVVSLPIAAIVAPPRERRIRGADDNTDLDQMIASLQAHGLLEPIGVRALEDGARYELVYGSRRLASARLLGWESIRCVLHLQLDPESAMADALAENLHRKELSSRERAAALRQLAKLHEPGKQLGGFSTGGHAAIQPPPRQDNSSAGWARKLGVDVSTVSRLAALGRDEDLLSRVEDGQLGLTAASHVARLPEPMRAPMLEEISSERLSATAVHRRVNQKLRDRNTGTVSVEPLGTSVELLEPSRALHALRCCLGILASVDVVTTDQELRVVEQIGEHVERLRGKRKRRREVA